MTSPPGTKLVLVVIDGLTPQMLEASLDDSSLPTLAALAGRGTLARATTSFPSLTPVCLSSIATGAYPDVHEIPHLVWWHRGERRLVEYGSSFGAARAAGLGRTLRDTLVGMNAEHLGPRAVTLFEALADAELGTAAVNFTAYRGRTVHRAAVPVVVANVRHALPDGGIDAQLFIQLALQRLLRALARLNLAAGKLPLQCHGLVGPPLANQYFAGAHNQCRSHKPQGRTGRPRGGNWAPIFHIASVTALIHSRSGNQDIFSSAGIPGVTCCNSIHGTLDGERVTPNAGCPILRAAKGGNHDQEFGSGCPRSLAFGDRGWNMQLNLNAPSFAQRGVGTTIRNSEVGAPGPSQLGVGIWMSCAWTSPEAPHLPLPEMGETKAASQPASS